MWSGIFLWLWLAFSWWLNVEHVFMCLLAICISSLEKCLSKPFAHLLLFIFFIYLRHKFFVRYMVFKYLFPFCGLYFICSVLWRTNVLNFVCFFFVACAFDVKSKKPLPYGASKIYSCFHLEFILLIFTFRLFICFEVIFVYGVRWR